MNRIMGQRLKYFQWVFGAPMHDEFDYEDHEKILSMEVMTKWTHFAKYGYACFKFV